MKDYDRYFDNDTRHKDKIERISDDFIDIPRDWRLSPEVISLNWSEQQPLPSSHLISIVFPEFNSHSYFSEKKLRYAITIANVPWCTLTSENNISDINLPVDGLVHYQLNFHHFELLKNGQNTTAIKATCFEEGFSVLNPKIISERTIKISVFKTTEINNASISTNKSEYYINYNQTNKELTGDLDIRLNLENIPEDSFIRFKQLNNDGSIKPIKIQLNSEKEQLITDNSFIFRRVHNSLFRIVGLVNENAEIGSYTTHYKLKALQQFFVQQIPICESNPFTIITTVKSGIVGLTVSEDKFDFRLRKSENKKATGQFVIRKNSDLNITISADTDLEISEEKKSDTEILVKFQSKKASFLKKGLHKKNIYIYDTTPYCLNSITVAVTIEVIADVDYVRNDVMFCLDDEPMVVYQTSAKATFVRAVFDLKYTNYQGHFYEIHQTYEYVYFDGKAILYPGEEVQDFFEDIRSLSDFTINESDIVRAAVLFKAVEGTISITEYDGEGHEYKSYLLKDLHYLPGKKPKAFPYLTNATVRSTYSNSLVALSALAMDMKSKSLGLIASHLTDTSALTNDYDVANISFRRSITDKSYGALKIISKATLSLEPKREIPDTIDALFQNQNYCPEWFTFAEEYDESKELEQVVSENAILGKEFKVLVKQKRYLILNTGWIFQEEISILDELLTSNICFIRLKGKWIKTIPIDKKPLPLKSDRNLNSMLVKLKIVDDAR